MDCSIKALTSLVIGLLCLFAPWRAAQALDPSKAITQYVHTTWRMDDGLPHNGVTRVLQTKDGYLWVGTQGGLARFDGVRFTVFNHSNTPALPSDFISGLVEDRQGTLWIATRNNGVLFYRNGRFSQVPGVGVQYGARIAADPGGGLWVGGEGDLKLLENGVVVKKYTAADGLSGNRVTRIAVGRDGDVWIGGLPGLDRLSHGKITSFSTRDGLPNNNITGITIDTDGTVWVKTNNSDIARFDNGRFVPWRVAGVEGATVRDLLQDRDGNLWISSGSQGLLRVSGAQVLRFSVEQGLSSDATTSLYEDHDGNLWVGTNGGGLERFSDGSFTTYSKVEGLSADQTYAVLEDKSGDIWISTPKGLDQLRGGQVVRTYQTPDQAEPTALLEDHQASLLVGTSVGGVSRLVGGALMPVLSASDGVPDYFISGLLEDTAHRLWLAPRGGGLVRYGGGKASVFAAIDPQSKGFWGVYATAEGPDGTIWAATDSGLISVRNGQVRRYPAKALVGAWVVSLFFDSRNALWIGTVGHGMFRLDKGQLTRYTTHQGLLDDNINSIIEDNDGNLWVGSDHGISRITRRDIDAVSASTSRTMQPITFGKTDGMKSSATNGGTQPGAWRGRDGRLWFTTGQGVAVVDPAHLLLDAGPRLAGIEEVIADQQPVSLLAPIVFAAGTGRLEIRFTAPALSAAQRTRFRYRLDGFETQWVPAGFQRIAQYTNLSPGHYTFHVSARSESGQWSTQEATLGFDLSPRFYQTWWFRLMCWFAALSLLFGAYRLRVNWLHARAAVHDERQRIASDIHDSLAQGLSGIIFLTQAALISITREPEMTTHHLTSARDLAKASLDDARYSVWDLSAPVLDDKNLIESLSTMARQIARGRVEELDIHTSGTEWQLQPAGNHNVVMIAQEAISNAIQHGLARTVAVDLAYSSDALHLTVSDDGRGFIANTEVQQHSRGYGMRNMRHRAERLGAGLHVVSEIGKGTTISLKIPRLGRFAKIWRVLRGKTFASVDR